MIRSEDVYPSSVLRETAIRVVKTVPGIYGLPTFHADADFFMEVIDDPRYCYETENEFVFYVRHTVLTDACLATCSFNKDEAFDIQAILCEGRSLYFTNKHGMVTFQFEISGLSGATRTLYVHTLLREPGLTIRLEQNHPGRRAGKYRDERYPETEILAANHYMWATREALIMLGIPEYLNSESLGYMLLLGFETNNEVHGDYPSHWHLIYRWPKHCGSQAPHLYLNEAGAITKNVRSIDMIHGASKSYQTGEWCKFVDCYGRDVCAITITQAGGMMITKPNGDIYSISAYSEAGVCVSRNGQPVGQVHLTNDPDQGIYVVHWECASCDAAPSYTRTIHYNSLTGAVISDITDAMKGNV